MSRLDEALTAQFYSWESRGRGARIFDHPASLEPPFVPFIGYTAPTSPAFDDGRKPTALSSFMERLGLGSTPPPPKLEPPPIPKESSMEWREAQVCVELQLSLPISRTVPALQVETFIRHAARPGESLSLELLGTERETVPQFVASPRTATRIETAAASCFPGLVRAPAGGSAEARDALHRAWHDSESRFAVVELGLGREWMLPLGNPRGDLLASVASAMDGLGKKELSLLQVMFEPVRAPWADSMMNAVTYADGSSLFVNRPDLLKGAELKAASPLFAVVIRLASSAATTRRTWEIITDMAATLSALARPGSNFLVPLDDDGYPRGQPLLYAESFSPNTPEGACQRCHGLGRVYEVTEQSMVPDESLSIRERAIAAWPPAWHGQNLRDIVTTLGYDIDTPWRKLPKKDRDWLLFTDEQPVVPVYAGWTREEVRAAIKRREPPSYMGTFTGAKKYVLETFAKTESASMKKRVARYMVSSECPLCNGRRLRAAALSVKFAGLDISEISNLPLKRLAKVLCPHAEGNAPGWAKLEAEHPEKAEVTRRIAQDLCARLAVLLDLGLGYLSLDRSTPTLSPGELQRLRLATQVRSNLFGVVYVLDEPSAGLHPADTEALLVALEKLKASGNSLFVVEHELDVIDGYADRQDLRLSLLKIARKEGVRISLGTDAHHPEQLAFMELALAAAYLAKIPAHRIVPFLPLGDFKQWVAEVRGK